MFQLILGVGLASFVMGGLLDRVPDPQDVLPPPIEGIFLGVVFALAAAPTRWAIVPRALLPLPAFLLFLVILTGRNPPLPFSIAFICAWLYALALTGYSTYVAHRGLRSRLGR
jgi:hypothetical protein